MKFRNILEEILSSKIKISVMKILYRYPEKKFSGRELARILNVSPSRASEILEIYRQYGVANRIRIGNTSEWTLNILYGSVPKGKEQPDSDIDLFILVKNQKDKELAAELVHKLNISLLPRYGNVISELIYSKEEWKLKKNSKILRQIQSEGEIILERA